MTNTDVRIAVSGRKEIWEERETEAVREVVRELIIFVANLW